MPTKILGHVKQNLPIIKILRRTKQCNSTQTLKPKLTEPVVSATVSKGKKEPTVAATGGMTGGATGGATGVTGGATASGTGSAKSSGKKNVKRFNIDSSNYVEDDTRTKNVKPAIKVAKKKNSTNSTAF